MQSKFKRSPSGGKPQLSWAKVFCRCPKPARLGRKYGKLLITIEGNLIQHLELAHLKKTFTFILLAILIAAVVPAFVVPNVKADASEAKVVSYSFYVASSSGILSAKAGDLVVVGEVQNVGSGIIQNVTVSAAATDSSGNTLGTATGFALTYETLPQGKAPFVIDFSPANTWSSEVAKVNVTVVNVLDATSPPYQGLQVPSPGAFNMTDNGVYLTGGTVVNKGQTTLNYVWVVTTFYNSANTVVGLNFTDYIITPLSPLKPNGAIYWRASPADNSAALSNEIASFSYVIDSTPASGSSSTGGTPTPSGGASGSSSSGFPWLPVIVVVVIAVVAVAALMLLRKRTPPPPPPPPSETQEEQPGAQEQPTPEDEIFGDTETENSES